MTIMRKLPVIASEPGQRGDAEHGRRHQIITVAAHQFRLYGFRKTSVAELANAVDVSSTYTYRFFRSKQAIGEAVVAVVLGDPDEKLKRVLDEDDTVTIAAVVGLIQRSMVRHVIELRMDIFVTQ